MGTPSRGFIKLYNTLTDACTSPSQAYITIPPLWVTTFHFGTLETENTANYIELARSDEVRMWTHRASVTTVITSVVSLCTRTVVMGTAPSYFTHTISEGTADISSTVPKNTAQYRLQSIGLKIKQLQGEYQQGSNWSYPRLGHAQCHTTCYSQLVGAAASMHQAARWLETYRPCGDTDA